jgi:PAS domain S-box-containing protein
MTALPRRALLLVLILGVLYWTLDSVYLYVSYRAGEVVLPGADGPSLVGVFATDVPRHALAGRVTFLAAMVVVAALAVMWLRHRDRREIGLLHQLESAGDLFSRHDLEGRFLYASAGFETLLGIDPGQLLGRRAVPGWAVINRTDLESSLQRIAASDHPVAVTTRLRSTEGREIWLESVGRRVVSAGRAEVVVISRDVTGRHEAEAALAASEQRLRLITENMQEILWLRVGDRLQYINSAVERIFGVPHDQLGDRGLRSWLPWMHPDDRDRMRLAMDQALDHHEPLDEEFRIVRPDGQIRWLHARTVHVEIDRAGRPVSVGVAADITGRRRAEDALRSTAARYRTLYDAAHVGITITDLRGGVIYANPVAAELFGAGSVGDLLDHVRRNDGIRGLFRQPVERDDFVQAMQADERGRASRTFAMRRLDGQEIQMRVSCGLLTNPESRRQEILAILEDVTERQRAEAELRLSEERYRRLVDFIPDGILVHDGQRVVLANPACAELFGLAARELVGTKLAQLVPDASLLVPAEGPAERELANREGWLVRADGVRVPAALTSLPLHDGESRRVLTVIKDLTRLRQAGEEIAAQQAILAALIETMPLGIVAKDLDHDLRYVVWNRYMEEELGLAKAEVIGQLDREVFATEFAEEMRRQDRIAATRGETVALGDVSLPWRGRRLELSLVKVPVRDASGRVSRIFTIVENVTEQKQLHASLQQSRRMEAVGRLAAAVAHDFNNMLQVVQGYTEAIRQGLQTADRVDDEVALVLTAVARARELVQRLLAYSRYDSLKPELIDPSELCQRVIAMSRNTLPEGLAVAFAPGAEVPRIYADPLQIEQVLLNLLLNARDALPGEGTVEVDTKLVELGQEFCTTRPWARPGRYVQITVRDDGCGIPPGARERIYEPFYTTKGFGQGTGLGLATAYNICKQHQGYIDFESELDVGTSFHVFLPVPEVPAGESLDPAASETRPRGRGELLLLVEDDDLVRSLTRQMLERAGYQVLDARDGEDAMEVFMAHAAEIQGLVLDVVMPRMDGRMLYDNISELRPGVPVLFCSSYSADLLESEYMLEIDAVLLSKPYRAADLLQKVRELLDR